MTSFASRTEQTLRVIAAKTGMKQSLVEDMLKPESLEDFLLFFERIQRKICDSYGGRNGGGGVREPIMRLAVYGFSDIHVRIQLFEVFRHVFKAQWHFASEPNRGAANRWEMLVVFRQSSHFTMEDIEDLAAMLRLSVVCDDIGSKLDEVLMAFVERIESGTKKSGYLRVKLRSRLNEFKQRVDEREGRQRVLETTGRPLTSGNTLFYYHEMNNTRQELDRLREQHRLLNNRYVAEFRSHHNTRKTAMEVFGALSRIQDIMTSQIATLESLRSQLSSLGRYRSMLDRLQEALNNPCHAVYQGNQQGNQESPEDHDAVIERISGLLQAMRNEVDCPTVAELTKLVEDISAFVHHDLDDFRSNIVTINDIVASSTNTLREYLIGQLPPVTDAWNRAEQQREARDFLERLERETAAIESTPDVYHTIEWRSSRRSANRLRDPRGPRLIVGMTDDSQEAQEARLEVAQLEEAQLEEAHMEAHIDNVLVIPPPPPLTREPPSLQSLPNLASQALGPSTRLSPSHPMLTSHPHPAAHPGAHPGAHPAAHLGVHPGHPGGAHSDTESITASGRFLPQNQAISMNPLHQTSGASGANQMNGEAGRSESDPSVFASRRGHLIIDETTRF